MNPPHKAFSSLWMRHLRAQLQLSAITIKGNTFIVVFSSHNDTWPCYSAYPHLKQWFPPR
jgi:hypothetical protein